ncbi:MAG TPA: PaaI family thioesterase [Acidimicrobiia bacterium]|nr:PaaI family thioesterase [Acidimicrobiia bacterium]
MSGFEETIGLQVVEASAARVVGEIEIEDRHRQPYGIVHGGVYCSMIETLASYGAAMWATEQGWFGAVGLSNSTDFLRATRSGVIAAEALPIHQGRSQQIWQVIVTRTLDGKVAARGQVRLHNLIAMGDVKG